MGRTGPLLEPRRRPQAGKSGYPHSQNADSSPRAQGALGLGLAEKRRGKCEAPRAPIACGLGRRVAVDWTWASWLPHDASATARIDKSLHAKWVMITCDRGGRRLASLGYMYGTARALPIHLFPLLFVFLFVLAPPFANGTDPSVFCRREGEGPPRGSCPASSEETARLLPRGRGCLAGGVEAMVRAAAAWIPIALVRPDRGS